MKSQEKMNANLLKIKFLLYLLKCKQLMFVKKLSFGTAAYHEDCMNLTLRSGFQILGTDKMKGKAIPLFLLQSITYYFSPYFFDSLKFKMLSIKKYPNAAPTTVGIT